MFTVHSLGTYLQAQVLIVSVDTYGCKFRHGLDSGLGRTWVLASDGEYSVTIDSMPR